MLRLFASLLWFVFLSIHSAEACIRGHGCFVVSFFGAENGVIPNIPETLIKSISPVSQAVFFRLDNSPNDRSLHSEFLCPVPNDL